MTCCRGWRVDVKICQEQWTNLWSQQVTRHKQNEKNSHQQKALVGGIKVERRESCERSLTLSSQHFDLPDEQQIRLTHRKRWNIVYVSSKNKIENDWNILSATSFQSKFLIPFHADHLVFTLNQSSATTESTDRIHVYLWIDEWFTNTYFPDKLEHIKGFTLIQWFLIMCVFLVMRRISSNFVSFHGNHEWSKGLCSLFPPSIHYKIMI